MSQFCDHGYCPHCYSEGHEVPLAVNRDDFWECNNCHLQLVSDGGMTVAVLPWRGEGLFRDSQTDPSQLHDSIITGSVRVGSGIFTDDLENQLSTKEKLQDYVKHHVFETYELYEESLNK